MVAALAAPLWLHAGVARGAFLGAATGLSGLSVFLLLLATTPGDAIRLPRWGSAVAIALGTGMLAALAGAPAFAAAGLALVGALMAMLSGVRMFRRDPHSPWLYTLLLWHPGVWMAPTVRQASPEAAAAMMDWFWIVLLAIGVSVAAITPRQSESGRLSRAGAVTAVLAWQLAGAVALWLAWTYAP